MPICSGGQGSATITDSRAMSKPKPGSRCVGERGEPLDEQRADLVRIAQRPRRAGGDAAHLTVGTEQRQLEPARAVTAPLQRALQAAPPAVR